MKTSISPASVDSLPEAVFLFESVLARILWARPIRFRLVTARQRAGKEITMKTTVRYNCASYGNDISASDYSVKLTRAEEHILIDFELAHPAPGRGVGPARGHVESAMLELSRDAADALSRALQMILASTASKVLEFEIREVPKTEERIRLAS
jgi:hypothetical protein